MAGARRDGWRTAMSAALPVWLASRVAVALISIAGMWTLRGEEASRLPGFLAIWDRWDVGLYRKVAEFGYFSDAYPDRTEPFFPGMPMVLRAVHLVVPNWTAAGLCVSLVAGGVAVTALWRLAADESGPAAAGRAVLYLVLFPYAVFLFAGYSEALFLAFVVPAWLAAKNDRWWLAGLLAAGATATRLTGLCFVAGLGVQYLVAHRGRPRWDVLALALPVASATAYLGFLRVRTGHWDAYSRAQEEGWGRDLVSPVDAFRTMVALARDPDQSAAFLWSWRAEIAAVLLGVALTAVLFATRRWGEAVYVGSNTAILSVSSYYASGVRAVIVWFPLFLLLGRLSVRREWLHGALVWTGAPLMAAFVVAFTTGAWLG